MELFSIKNDVLLQDFGKINLSLTLDCGQAFRWSKTASGRYSGIAAGKETEVGEVDGGIMFYNTSEEDVRSVWLDYFDTARDYESILTALSQDPHMAEAVKEYGTIRILNQQPWETLCSFIISACNNIPRIKGIVTRLCEGLGDRLENGYSFPSAEKLACLTPDDLAFLRAGYRAPYIIDAAKKVASGECDLDALRKLEPAAAEKELMKISGVGKKVADCTMLFGLGFSDTYPVDRHIARANAEYYPDGLPECFNGYRGLAQQYIFYYQMSGSSKT